MIDPDEDLPSDVHVYPVNDLEPHAMSRFCWCGPTCSQAPGEDVLVVHRAFDGRDLIEQHGVN
jgi:hypothetical protein